MSRYIVTRVEPFIGDKITWEVTDTRYTGSSGYSEAKVIGTFDTEEQARQFVEDQKSQGGSEDNG